MIYIIKPNQYEIIIGRAVNSDMSMSFQISNADFRSYSQRRGPSPWGLRYHN